MTLSEYLSQVSTAIRTRNGVGLRHALTINPGVAEGTERSKFAEALEFDLYPLPERFRPVVKDYLRLMKLVYVLNDVLRTFEDLVAVTGGLNRAADGETNWISPALVNCCSELMSVYKVMRKSAGGGSVDSAAGSSTDEENSSDPSLEKVAAVLSRSFQVCLNDKNLEASELKRRDVYFFLALLLRVYFQLDRLELARSVEKALHGTGAPPEPKLASAHHKSLATYLYYSAQLSLDEGDFAAAEAKLSRTADLLAYAVDAKAVARPLEAVVLLLVPLRLHVRRRAPANELWTRHPALCDVYRDGLLAAVRTANLKLYDATVDKFRRLFLQRNLFLLVQTLRSLCVLQVVRKTAAVYRQVLANDSSAHIVPFLAFVAAFSISSGSNWSSEAVECQLAILISKGLVKGYLSHANKCIVLSKVLPFPK